MPSNVKILFHAHPVWKTSIELIQDIVYACKPKKSKWTKEAGSTKCYSTKRVLCEQQSGLNVFCWLKWLSKTCNVTKSSEVKWDQLLKKCDKAWKCLKMIVKSEKSRRRSQNTDTNFCLQIFRLGLGIKPSPPVSGCMKQSSTHPFNSSANRQTVNRIVDTNQVVGKFQATISRKQSCFDMILWKW